MGILLAMIQPVPLRFKVASHIVEDLGLNLYTSLPRVLVEFVANAYDADSPRADIRLDAEAIKRHRKAVLVSYKKDVALDQANNPDGAQGAPPVALAQRCLPAHVTIVIEDSGVGMTRQELQDKFLVAGRRRRAEGFVVTEKNRAVMGRKGLGKLAGFGVAKTVTIVSRARGAETATKITLDYDALVQQQTTEGIIIPDEEITDDKILPNGGTTITLSQLLYDPMKSRESTIENDIADHFELIDPEDFRITMNNKSIVPTPKDLVYAWPRPDDLGVDEFVSHRLRLDGEENEDDEFIEFRYRIRFTSKPLTAADRGVRVYANKRLAASPSLLDAPTGMHGFRMTDYLDGVVHANFIDEQATDYIATDRQGLRWDAPQLYAMRSFLSGEIKAACVARQAERDEERESAVSDDEFTQQQIASHSFTSAEKRLAKQVATALSRTHDDGVDDVGYKAKLPPILQAIGHGNILTAITKLAEDEHPQLSHLVAEITRLTKDELESFTRFAKVRLTAIGTLKRIVEGTDFKAADNEKLIQKLLEKNPWLIDATYNQVLSADTRSDSVYSLLAKHLEIGEHASTPAHPEKRPDLVFLLGNAKAERLIIVELKSANKALDNTHLDQLELYMEIAHVWLTEHGHNTKVEGHLIGTYAEPASRAASVMLLRRKLRESGPTVAWRVRDYLTLLNETEAAHRELLNIQSKHASDRPEA
jgi:hypothetical protein